MAILVDTSVWVDLFRDQTGERRTQLLEALGGEEIVLSRFVELELLQGARDEREWGLLVDYLGTQDLVELPATGWREAARIYFDLRRDGRTVRSPIDCCIAQLAIERDPHPPPGRRLRNDRARPAAPTGTDDLVSRIGICALRIGRRFHPFRPLASL